MQPARRGPDRRAVGRIENAAVLSSQDWVGAVSSRAWKSEREREDAMSCVVWEGLFSARGAASQPGDVRHGAVGGGGGGGETRRVSVATPESLCLLSRLRVGRQYSNGHADAGSYVREDTRLVGRDREGCARFQDAAALFAGLERNYSRRKGRARRRPEGGQGGFWGGGKPDIASASAIVEARDGLGAPA